MSRTPNSEQLLAIEHEGGVLLRAGAGSGKTFVLVEHIVYLTRKWMNDYSSVIGLSFEDYLRQKYSQVVMMTFTKKAAGEMSIRLTERFSELAEAEENKSLWAVANEAIPMLMVTTIDGFCRKLITAGYFPHLSTEAKIIFDTERIDQVKELLLKWFEKRSDRVPTDILDIVIREKKDLLKAFSSIFNDPGLRLSWKKFSLAHAHPEKIGEVLTHSFKLNGVSDALFKIQALDLPADTERSAFEKFVGEAQATGLPEVDHVDKLEIYFKLFEGKRLNPERTASKKSPAHDNALEGLKIIRDWSKGWYGICLDYNAHYETKILPWLKLCQELFNWIDEGLDPNQGMTFGDIAYFVALGLDQQEHRERIQKTYNYFIVDEFQDTSALQFKIIQRLIGEDYSRLFCVGDAKQAIYGFRGGELSVFQDCGDLIPQVRSLANNYRSLPEVIEFNNSLFKTILPLGQAFEGQDPFSVVPEDQNVPRDIERSQEQGSIEIISAPLKKDLEEEKFSNEAINRLEAHLIAQSIKLQRESNPSDVCTVLYSKLKPSAELIRSLMNAKIGFTAQFKIDLLDDPIIGMFVCLLRRQFDSNSITKDRYPLFILKSYLNVLNLSVDVSTKALEDFDHNVKYWGLLEAYRKFLHHLHLTNENSDINIQVLEIISELYHQDPESIMIQLTRGDNQRISLDLRSGENSHMVQIMTAHASKGLEFENVYLGGIYTNGRERSDGPLFGNIPGSFKWYLDLSLRQKQESPYYAYEQELSKYKSFSESKRLFYVACTRAKKKLFWVDFHLNKELFNIPRNSWIDGLSVWLNQGMSSHNVEVKQVQNFDWRSILAGQSLPQLPLFFHDSVGIFSKGEGSSELAIAAELSVTRLNALLDCPRKFYLSNILKLNELDNIHPGYIEEKVEDGEEELATVIRSSADRGTYIHAQIAKGIERNFVVPRESFGTEQQAPVEWALDLLKNKTVEFELVAEKQIKFKFFNFMISGIPDLILMPKTNQKAQVWDFKTGRITQDNLNHYWLQLSTYAYALYELGKIPKTSEVELVLCFVDEKKNLTEFVTYSKCEQDLYPIWRSQNEPWKTNLDHCSQCSYGSICPR